MNEFTPTNESTIQAQHQTLYKIDQFFKFKWFLNLLRHLHKTLSVNAFLALNPVSTWFTSHANSLLWSFFDGRHAMERNESAVPFSNRFVHRWMDSTIRFPLMKIFISGSGFAFRAAHVTFSDVSSLIWIVPLDGWSRNETSVGETKMKKNLDVSSPIGYKFRFCLKFSDVPKNRKNCI